MKRLNQNSFRDKLIISTLRALILITIHGQLVYDVDSLSTNAFLSQCHSVNGQSGICVSFEMCPPMLKILKEEVHTAENIRLLQRLTCGFEKEEPMICCPANKVTIVGEEEKQTSTKAPRPRPRPRPSPSPSPTPEYPFEQITGNAVKIQPSATVSTPTILTAAPTYAPTEASTKAAEGNANDWNQFLPEEKEESIASERFQGKLSNFRNHPNFKLLPKLKDCSTAIQTDRIVGGTTASLASYPWMARIGYRSEETGEIEFYCGGSIINNRYILTAGHCTEEIDSEVLTPALVRVGEHDVSTEEDCSPNIGCTKYTDYKIEKIIPHESYNTDDKSNDIELIRVDREMSFDTFAVSPICLPFPVEYGLANVWRNSFVPSRNKAFVTGWGRTKWNRADGSTTLQEVQLPIVPNARCQANYTDRIKISSKQMCAGGVKDKDSCGGDSGGPLQFPIMIGAEGKFFQLGVVSFGPVQCGVGLLPGVYTRVSAYRDWILENLRP